MSSVRLSITNCNVEHKNRSHFSRNWAARKNKIFNSSLLLFWQHEKYLLILNHARQKSADIISEAKKIHDPIYLFFSNSTAVLLFFNHHTTAGTKFFSFLKNVIHFQVYYFRNFLLGARIKSNKSRSEDKKCAVHMYVWFLWFKRECSEVPRTFTW